MANEIAVPLLPCASIDEMADFYQALGFRTTHHQTRPNPYVAMQREDLHLHFFGMPDYLPADSYSTCLVLVPDTEALHREFAAGLRARYGRVPLAGIPRMTRPRARKNAGGTSGFSVVDPGGNWIRITSNTPPPATVTSPLATTMANAVVLADSKGDHRQAARILDGALGRPAAGDDPALAEVLLYRAELAVTLSDPDAARLALARAAGLPLTPDQRAVLDELSD
ncbi:VOC family protein [Actinoplanes awajinensis]|uniref:Bleomycin resistance protein n=1 Tax=Actinoplanes awajinensis subsp. mycoplanecinus TaxID=135947 RepID=A0A101J777_9ACTN|nr:hypothetical protein [Actinoplanes awajinensis]KUL21509.1 hypothetical protein ADL15_50585 [Actinoplanes awajinensis subsp. mycoplanecinus]